jgi:hypothetical protein
MAIWLAEGLHGVFLRLRGRAGALAVAALAAAATLAAIALPVASVGTNWRTHNLAQEHGARAFLDAALAEAETGAVILTAGDQRTFALWYGIYGLGRRPDLAVINVNLWGYEWHRRSLAETHPYLLPLLDAAPPLEALIASLAAVRPVYAAEDLGLDLPQLEPSEAGQAPGVLTRLLGPPR